ncbi:MAG: radical SAM protein [Clostridia bacterium]|nr:radical SAM protein [Clostridia bacterium]
MKCTLCPRRCNIEREPLEGKGVCGVGTQAKIARAELHFDEEPVISGSGGSGAIFFSGCQLKCVFCQNYAVSHDAYGKIVTAERLKEIYKELVSKGARNINLVSASHYAPVVLDSLKEKPPVPVIWNSSGYEKVETIRMLKGAVDVYLPDFKYALSEPARKYSLAGDYFDYAKDAIAEMLDQTGPVVLDEDGYIQKGVIIRHLILPGQTENSRRVLKYIKDHFPGAWVSLMAQYVPMGNAQNYPEINRRITEAEYDEVVNYMLDLGLEDGFIQDLESADAKYTPEFDLTGV